MKNKEAAPILKKIKRPRRIVFLDEDWGNLAALTALVRPGPLEINHELIRRLNDVNPIEEPTDDIPPEINY